MNRGRDEQRPASVAEEAARWFTRLQDDAATGDDWLEFERWFAASPDHAAAYERLEGLWVELDAAGDALQAVLDTPVSLDERRQTRERPKTLSRRGWLAAGAAVAASLAIVAVGLSNRPAPPAEIHATAAGETRQITLADGTKVWLNAGSQIQSRFERRARRVEMADAEAAFDVTHDPARPFLISVGDREVRVVGTEFNLRRRSGEIALTVRRGVVEVRPAGSPEATPTRVAAGQQLIHREGTPNSVLTSARPDTAFAWTQGQLIYEDAALHQVAEDLSRSLGVPVRVADPAAGRIRFTGVLALDDKAAVMRRLEAFGPIRAEQRDGGVVLHRR
jgi:transmembrane sensor